MESSHNKSSGIVRSRHLNSSDKDVNKDAKVEGKKGQSNNHDVEKANPALNMVLGADSKTSNSITTTIVERRNALKKNTVIASKIRDSAKDRCLHEITKTVIKSEEGVIKDTGVDEKTIMQFSLVMKEMSSVSSDGGNPENIDNGTEGGKDVPSQIPHDSHNVVNHINAGANDFVVEANSVVSSLDDDLLNVSKPVAQSIKSSSRILVFFKKLKRSVRSVIINKFDNVKSKDFKAMPANVLEVFTGTDLKSIADDYNKLRSELMAMNDTSGVKEGERKDLKKKLLVQCMSLDKEIDKMIFAVESSLDSACSVLSDKDRRILAEKLRSKVGFDMTTVKVKKEVEGIEGDAVLNDGGDVAGTDSFAKNTTALEYMEMNISKQDDGQPSSYDSDEPIYANVTPRSKGSNPIYDTPAPIDSSEPIYANVTPRSKDSNPIDDTPRSIDSSESIYEDGISMKTSESDDEPFSGDDNSSGYEEINFPPTPKK